MVETDWREVLSFSQRELMQADKEKLCESLSWMEADDIELNFTDLKTLFRLAQDILKYKSEQVNNLMGQLESSQRKTRKKKVKTRVMDSPNKSPESVTETIAHQDEIIKANKEILERLYLDIAELEGKRKKLEDDKSTFDKDSESSRDPLSEMNEVKQLENEITLKNKHIRKLLIDVKSLEEDNTQLKDKISMLKEKLTEATQLIENLTDQMLTINNECFQIKDALGKSEKSKSQLTHELESLKNELFEKNAANDNFYEDIKAKVQHWKNMARSKKHEAEVISSENTKLKEQLETVIRKIKNEVKGNVEENLDHEKIKELQEKLSEASNEILQSVNVIELLKTENRQLKSTIEETHETVSISDARNESDDGKQRALINKLKRRVKVLTISLQGAEEMIAEREKEITEITSQLLLVRSDEGINALIDGIKNKKRQLKIKDEGIKSLVNEVNALNQLVNDLQLENEVLRNRLNIAPEEKIPTQGLMYKYRQLEIDNNELSNELRKIENKLVAVELRCRQYSIKIEKLIQILNKLGYNNDVINKTSESSDDNDIMPTDSSRDRKEGSLRKKKFDDLSDNSNKNSRDYKDLVEENDGLRKGLEEILQYLKDNSTTSSGLLALQCPSLEAVLHSLDSRHSAGWYAPHMSAVMEAKTAKGGRDALLNALHEARKETYDALTQLSKESQKSQELEQKLIDATKKSEQIESISSEFDIGEFGTWISETDPKDVDLYDKSKIEAFVNEGNSIHEKQLKKALTYFHKKFKELYEKINSLLIRAIDDQNNYFIKEERYKAQIECLKAQLDLHDENDISEDSPGLVALVNPIVLQRKCSYLEESYKYIRTLNENIKIEYIESKRDAMVLKNDYESKIQKLILSVANLSDKLRKSISVDLFWKQNELLNDFVMKYRNQLNSAIKSSSDSIELEKRLENEKVQIIRHIEAAHLNGEKGNGALKHMLSTVENSVLQKQLEHTCAELINTQQEVEKLRAIISELQEKEIKLIDRTLSSYSMEEIDLMKNQLKQIAEENQTLKEQCQHIRNQLDIALLQLQDSQQRQMSNDMETNMLRHQILDLQSTGDNKAIVARLSGEVLVAHLQASESHKKIERLNTALQDEKQARAEIEEMMQARQTIFDVYSLRYESKFRYMFEVMQVLRQQYQGALPITSLENYVNNLEDIFRKTKTVNDTLDEIEDLRSELITKHSVYNQILEISKNKCIDDDNNCSHKLKNMVLEKMHLREKEHSLKKVQTLELSQEQLTKQCNDLEKTLLMTNQGFEKTNFEEIVERRNYIQKETIPHLELEDIVSDDEQSSRRSKTIILPKPQILKSPKSVELNLSKNGQDTSLPLNTSVAKETSSVFVQTTAIECHKECKVIQTDEDQNLSKLKQNIEKLKKELEIKTKKLSEMEVTTIKCNVELTALKKEKLDLEMSINKLKEADISRDNIISRLNSENDELRLQINQITNENFLDKSKTANEGKKSMLMALKQLEDEKNAIVKDYKQLLNNEREEYSKSVKDLHVKIMELQTQLDRKGSDSNTSNTEALKEVVGKYSIKIAELEDHSFKLQSELDNCRTELVTYQNEADRWKGLAVERLTKMEQLNFQLEERHNTEVESYKAENQHWLSQLGDSQKSHLELRNRLSEQKTLHVKLMAEKDSQIEQLRTIIYNLKTQIMNMQTMMSVNDPSFDLSAIVEVEESSDATSNCDKLELRFDSTTDINDTQHDEIIKIPASSTTIWQEPIIERLRREKQLALKQNAILRRQIKALAARERRSRLDAQNLKNQVFRISTSGRTPSTAENAALHSKVASLQAQLTSARRETHTGLALWDKWKRAQQSSDRWQARYEERCQEVKKMETSLNYCKSAVSRLDREKRLLLIRLNEIKDKRCSCIEKQEEEPLEKLQTDVGCSCSDSPVSARALLDRVEAQQRRIVALETAEKGNELLVSEYEKSLAEITALKGQLLKLESTLLESQIRMPFKTKEETPPELEYWKNYCDMLKEENMQMTLKINSLETTPTTANHQRVNDLEQTVLTLRGLVSKLQAEQKSNNVVVRRVDSRPSSGRSASEKARNYQDTYRTEVSNLKRSIQDKDLLLERSKEMLKIAAEREDELLRENAYLRRKLDELSRPKEGFLSA